MSNNNQSNNYKHITKNNNNIAFYSLANKIRVILKSQDSIILELKLAGKNALVKRSTRFTDLKAYLHTTLTR